MLPMETTPEPVRLESTKKLTERRTDHGPVWLALTHIDHKFLDDLFAIGGVGDLGMKLDSEDGFRFVGDGGIRGGRGGGHNLKMVW